MTIQSQLDQDSLSKLSVVIEAARINKWIRSPQEASQEFPEDCKVSETEAEKYFKGNFVLLGNPQQLLLN